MQRKTPASTPAISSTPQNYAQLFILLPDTISTPEAISQQLGLKPTEITTRGTPIHKKTGKGKARHRTLTKSTWVLSTQKMRLPDTCQAHVDWLLAQLGDKEDIIAQLQSQGCWVGVTCFWYIEKPTLTTEARAYLDNLHITLDFELERDESR